MYLHHTEVLQQNVRISSPRCDLPVVAYESRHCPAPVDDAEDTRQDLEFCLHDTTRISLCRRSEHGSASTREYGPRKQQRIWGPFSKDRHFLAGWLASSASSTCSTSLPLEFTQSQCPFSSLVLRPCEAASQTCVVVVVVPGSKVS